MVELINQPPGAPWWAVPLIAGCFLLLGGYLTFLLTRANDKTKFERERTSRGDSEIVELGAELLTAGHAVRDVGLLSLNRESDDYATVVMTRGKPALDTFVLASNRFQLVYPPAMKETLGTYLQWTMALLLPPYNRPGQLHALTEQRKSSHALLNALRAIQGREPLTLKAESDTLIENVEKATAILIDERAGAALQAKHRASQTAKTKTARAGE